MMYRNRIIHNYIDGYNTFAIDKMLADLDENIKFNNIYNGQVNLSLEGIESFRQQAETAKSYFSSRQQTIISIKHLDKETEVEVAYKAVLAIDFPNGVKRGEEIELTGRSIFEFAANKIIRLTDIS